MAGSQDSAVFVSRRPFLGRSPTRTDRKASGKRTGMFEQTFKNIDDVLWKEAGCATELDYTEQTSWILFLKYLDDLEKANEQKAELQSKKYTYIIDKAHRWSTWAAPKKRDGSFDHDRALTGDDLIKFVDQNLFPHLKNFRTRAESANTIEYKIGEIFSEIENKFRSGYSLRDALELMDGLSFRSQDQKHELSHIYEAKLRNMGNAGRNGGEYYTPRPLIRAMIQVVKTNPLNDDDLKDFIALQKRFKDSENSWTVDAKSIDKTTHDLSVKNPNKAEEAALRDPKEIIAEMAALDAESAEILRGIGRML
jgi:type I restriction-modification system DNA methylase subunit